MQSNSMYIEFIIIYVPVLVESLIYNSKEDIHIKFHKKIVCIATETIQRNNDVMGLLMTNVQMYM